MRASFLEGEPGVSHPYTASTLPEKVLRDTMETNFFAPVALTQALLPLLKKAPAGRIVNLASILGSLTLHSDPASPIYEMKSTAYDTSKTALNSFTVQLAYELKDSNVKVNSAHPGWVHTEMGGPSAPMNVEDGARPACAWPPCWRKAPAAASSTWVTPRALVSRACSVSVPRPDPGLGSGLAVHPRVAAHAQLFPESLDVKALAERAAFA